MDGSGTEFTPVVLPHTKEEIESAIVAATFRPGKRLELRTFYHLTADPVRLARLTWTFDWSS